MQGYAFSEGVRRVLAGARDESKALGHERVATEHILLALIDAADGPMASLWSALDIDAGALAQEVRAELRRGNPASGAAELSYTAAARKVLEFAMYEARALDDSYMGTAHLLLGVLAEGRGLAARELGARGVTLARARAVVGGMRE